MTFSKYAPVCWDTPFPNLCSGALYIILIVFILIIWYLITHKRLKEES